MPNNNRIPVGDRVKIYPRGKKKTYCADFWHHGKHCRKSLRTCNKKVATQRASQLDASLVSGNYAAPAPSTKIESAIDQYIEYLKSEGRAPGTIRRYSGILNTFCKMSNACGVNSLRQITPLEFDHYRAKRRKVIDPWTVYHESVIVKQLLKWCRQRKLVDVNPLEDYRFERPKRKSKGGPSLAQVNQILAKAKGDRQILFAFLAFTGARVGELQRLQQVDVDFKENWIHIVSRPGLETKTRNTWKVPIHPRLQAILLTMPKTKRNWFFTAAPSPWCPDGGNWIDPKKLNEDFKKILIELGIPAGRKNDGFTLHSLRHFFKTHCINCGIPKPVVDKWQDHKNDRNVGSDYYKLSDPESQRFMKKVSFDTGTSAADADKS